MRKFGMAGLIIFMLVIPSCIVSAERIETINSPMYLDDDVPIWNVGNSWTYQISEFSIDYTYEDLNIVMNGQIEDFKWTVSEVTSTSYIVDVEGKVSATFEGALPFGGSILNVNGDIESNRNKINGKIVFTKTNLEIEDFNAEIKGLAKVQIQPIPFKLPLPVKITADADLSTVFPLFSFPLKNPKIWNLPEIDITMKTSFGGIFGIIKIPLTFNTYYPFTPFAFSILGDMVTVTVPAGNYDAWRIKSTIGSFFEYYYAPSVGNLIKIDVNMPNGGIKGELVNKNYP
jgi:hypothetical protein